MLLLKYRLFFLLIVCILLCSATVYSAINFQGAIIDFKDVPTSAWRFGLRGSKWIVSIVNDQSQAKHIGLKQGDIILSLDDIDVVSYNDLLNLSVGKHQLKVFNKKNNTEIYTVNIFPIKNETNKENSYESHLPSIVVDDMLLLKKYGKSEVNSKIEKRSYQECMDDELANANTYEYYVTKPNSRGGDFGRAQRICDKEFGRRTGTSIERLY